MGAAPPGERHRGADCERRENRAHPARHPSPQDRNFGSLTGYLGLAATIETTLEASALTRTSVPGLRGPSALLRLQSDERLIEMTRRGQHAAFETLCSRYQSRLLSFCRHMLGSREDAEDVLQEVFAAAFNAVLADEREINVRPWLYRIARNRSLNHLRRASAVGVDSMDVHFADHGLSTSDRVLRRESFRELLADVQQLPETQHTALLLREIDALSYEQIAHAMETTVPSVKSLLVRARISLAEAAEARKLSCAEVRLELGEVAEGLAKLSVPARRHTRGCERCRFFKKQLKDNNHALAFMFPVGPLLLVKKLLFAKLGSTASAGGAHVAGGAGAAVSATAAAGAGGSGVAGGIFTAGAGALATKAVAGLAAAAMVTAGAVAAEHTTPPRHHAVPAASYASVASRAGEPVVVAERAQPLSAEPEKHAALPAAAHHPRQPAGIAKIASTTPSPLPASAVVPSTAVIAAPAKPVDPKPAETQVTQVTTETTQLPAGATTVEGQPSPPVTPAAAAGTAQPPAPAGAETDSGSGAVVEPAAGPSQGEPPAPTLGKGSAPVPESGKGSKPASPPGTGATSRPAGEPSGSSTLPLSREAGRASAADPASTS
jgi:RNA polymerase sigma factor (sigma-70 family)